MSSAKIAGVKEIIMITPPQEHFVPAILVAAKLAGVDSIYQVGGAQGVAALAFGTENDFQRLTRLQVPEIFSWRLLRSKFTVLSVLI